MAFCRAAEISCGVIDAVTAEATLPLTSSMLCRTLSDRPGTFSSSATVGA